MTEKEIELEKELALLTQHKNELDKEIKRLKIKCRTLENVQITLQKISMNLQPIMVYHTKSRNNTTIKFMNGETVTVKKEKGEKDCLETAIVYALVKHIYGKMEIKRLIELTKEIK